MASNGDRFRQSGHRSLGSKFEMQIEHALQSIESSFQCVASIIFTKLEEQRRHIRALLPQKYVSFHQSTYFGTAFFFPVKTIEDLDILEFRLREKEFQKRIGSVVYFPATFKVVFN